jgi:uncharacterized OB-fold protein
MSGSVPLDTGLFASLEPLRLAGSRCTACGTTTFPTQADCPRCARRTMEPHELPAEGVLWTWTVQAFEPKSPYLAPADGFVPFPVGYVDLGDVMVESRLAAEPADLKVGMQMSLVPWPVLVGPEESALGYAFSPAHSSSAGGS